MLLAVIVVGVRGRPVGLRVQFLAVDPQRLPEVRQHLLHAVDGGVEDLFDVLLMVEQPALKAGVGTFTGHCIEPAEHVEPAQVAQLEVAQQFAP